MEHFPIIQALCRTALADASLATRKQIERLRDALVKAGDDKQAASLAAMLMSAERNKEVVPSRLAKSRAQMPGEALSPGTPVPVDRETAAPVATLLFPEELRADPPVFNPVVSAAIESMLEEWRNLQALSALGVQPAKTCLIYGVPGTGKTRLAMWIARQLEMPVVLARLDGLVSSFLGTTARNIGNLFAFANRYRCLLLLDEFDAIAKLRDDPQEVGEIKRVVNALLQNLDGRQELGLTIGVTNHSKLLDPAVWRRFEVQLEVPKPDFNVRKDISRYFMAPVECPDSHFRLLAWFTEGLTGAEIEVLVRTYKKSMAVHGEGGRDLIETLRHFATLNSGRCEPGRRGLLFGDSKALFRAMKEAPELNFTMADIGEVAGRDKSTVSRAIGKRSSRFESPQTGKVTDGQPDPDRS